MSKSRKRAKSKLRTQTLWASAYESLESRQVMSAYFPAYIDGQLTLGDPASAAPYPLSETFNLSSNPQATKTIYLDFDGHRSVNDGWNHDIQFPAFDRDGNPNSFSNSELIEIQLQFQNVAEDYLPFNVNVTTRDPGVEALRRTNVNDIRYGIRSINSQATDGFGDNFGGVAFLNSFASRLDTPVFVFNKGVNAGAQTISHEVGHALGLQHDGLNDQAYHPGTGFGETSWGPLLGAPFSSNVTQFSNGDYAGSTTRQDDLAVITSNGFGYRVDDYGNSIATASGLDVDAGLVFDTGIIERNFDRDFLRFETASGNVRLDVNAFGGNPNLDVLARILDSNGQVIATSNPIDDVNASFNLDLNAGEYYLSIEGTGRPGRYSDYGSLGFYTVEGSLQQTSIPGAIGESGRAHEVNHLWKAVRFSQNYNDPVVIAGPASRAGGDRLTVRIRNVTQDGFEIRLDEYEYRDGRHGFETVDYLVVERGTHQLSDGTILQAGLADGQTQRWKYYNLGNSFTGETPVVFTQIMTNRESVAATTRFRNLDSGGFQLKIVEEQASDQAHAEEQIGWIAIEQGAGVTEGALFEALTTDNSVTHLETTLDFQSGFSQSPAFLAEIQSFDGGDTATLRYTNLNRARTSIFIEEERSLDSEVRHTTEVVGYLAFDRGPIFASGRNLPSPQTPGGGTVDPDGQFGHFGRLVDGNLSAAMAQVESRGDVIRPLGDEHDHDHDHDNGHEPNEFEDGHDHEAELDHDHHEIGSMEMDEVAHLIDLSEWLGRQRFVDRVFDSAFRRFGERFLDQISTRVRERVQDRIDFNLNQARESAHDFWDEARERADRWRDRWQAEVDDFFGGWF